MPRQSASTVTAVSPRSDSPTTTPLKAQASGPLIQCTICFDNWPLSDAQQLACGHRFCTQCLSLCQNANFCPSPGCMSARIAEVFVDEIDENNEDEPTEIAEKMNRVAFGPRQPALLKLEERQRCEARKGYFQCVNVARMTLIDCRHRVCFDCLAKRITNSDILKEMPRCPLPRCANLLTKSEITRVSEKVYSIQSACARIINTLPENSDEEKQASKDEVRVYCSMYNSEAPTRTLNVPKICSVADMLSALMQIHHLERNRTPNSVSLFIRNVTETGKVRYEHLSLKTLGKKPIRDANIHEKTHLVIDANNEIPK